MRFSSCCRIESMIGLCLSALLLSSLAVAEPVSALGPARRLVAAFNEHDPVTMASLVSENFELYYVDDKGVAALAVGVARTEPGGALATWCRVGIGSAVGGRYGPVVAASAQGEGQRNHNGGSDDSVDLSKHGWNSDA